MSDKVIKNFNFRKYEVKFSNFRVQKIDPLRACRDTVEIEGHTGRKCFFQKGCINGSKEQILLDFFTPFIKDIIDELISDVDSYSNDLRYRGKRKLYDEINKWIYEKIDEACNQIRIAHFYCNCSNGFIDDNEKEKFVSKPANLTKGACVAYASAEMDPFKNSVSFKAGMKKFFIWVVSTICKNIGTVFGTVFVGSISYLRHLILMH